jgi:hypothetical protein
MTDKLIIGWAINSVCLIHLIIRHEGGKASKFIALMMLAMPYLGAILYFIFFVWKIPPPQPHHLRHDRMNHYESTEYGNEKESDSSRAGTPPSGTSKRKRRFIGGPSTSTILIARVAFSLLGFVFIIYGILSIFRGMWSFDLWPGGASVFGPVAILGGCLLIYALIFRWDKA